MDDKLTKAMPSIRSKGWRRTFQAGALFVIYLVLSVTFFVALAQPGSALQAVIYGEDHLKDLRRTNDTTTVVAYADGAVSIVGTNGSVNMSCIPTTNGQVCTYTFASKYQSPRSYTLTLRGGNATLKKQYIVDGLGPTFLDATITQSGALVAEYTVHDSAYPSSPGCAGVSAIRLKSNSSTLAEKSFNGSACNAAGTLFAEVAGLDGQMALFLEAIDRLGNVGRSKIALLTVDGNPPALPSTFSFKRNGVEVTKVSTTAAAEIRGDLSFLLVEKRLAKVVVDASKLSVSEGSSYKSLTPTCVAADDAYNCTITGLRIDPSNATISIKIGASDTAGNMVAGVAAKTLVIENTPPTISYLGTEEPRCSGTCFARAGPNKILAVVDAPGGMKNAGLLFDFGGVKGSAKNCTEGNGWQCTASLTVAGKSGDRKTLKILSSSMDDLGNAFDPLSKEFVIDNDAPVLVGQPRTNFVCPTSVDTLLVSLTARDEQAKTLRISADVSKVTDKNLSEAECVATAGFEHNCTLPISGFLSTHTKAEIPLTVSDEAGNTLVVKMNLEVCEADPDATPNFIKNVKIVREPRVDKRLASLLPFRVMIPLTLEVTGGAKALQVRKVTCENQYIVGPSYVINEFTSAPVLVTHYQYDGVWPKGSVPLNCSMQFTMRRGDVVYLKPEIENITASLPLVGQELGNPGKAIKEKEASIIEEINDLEDQIAKREKIDKLLGKICSIAEMLGTFNALIQSVKALLESLSLVLHAIPILIPVANALHQAANHGLTSVHSAITNFIWPVGWFPTGANTVGLIVKWTCSLYECKLYDANRWASFAFAAGSYASSQRGGTIYTAPIGPRLGLDGTPFSSQLLSTPRIVTISGVDLNVADPLPTKYDVVHSVSPETQIATNNLISSIPSDDWIVNPYRSTKYDSLCIPAQLYNLRKERQLKCIELKCIREMAPTGLPITHCEERYAAQTCLYVESAQARMGESIQDILQNAFKQIGMLLLLGMATNLAYNVACGLKISTFTWRAVWAPVVPTGASESAMCGLVGSALHIMEVINMAKGLRSQNPTEPEGPDYCEGIAGGEP